MEKLGLVFILSVLLSSCSLSGTNKEEVTSRPSDELEFAVDTLDSPSENIKVEEQKVATKIPDEISPVERQAEVAEIKPEEMKIVTNTEEGKEQVIPAPEEPKFQDFQKKTPPIEISPAIAQEEVRPTTPTALGAEEKYQVQKGDTLMLVAFKLYGDYRKWRDLKEWNKDTKKMGPGAQLKYYVPEKAFGWQPSGLPYLIKTGDSLGSISMDKYRTPKKWRKIYENNRPLIRNPNLIFAGFTIYYVPPRDVASVHR
ncbi:MAG: LysM peptidoglycan-binding domain-containing protein [Bacteriovorax sp.]